MSGLDYEIYRNAKWKNVYFFWFLIIVALNAFVMVEIFLEVYFYNDAKISELCFGIFYGGKHYLYACIGVPNSTPKLCHLESL